MIQENNNPEVESPELEIVLSPDRLRLEERPSNDLTVDMNVARDRSLSDPEEGQTTERNIDRILKPIHNTLRPIGDAVKTPVVLAVDHFIPKIEKIPWYHFFMLSIIVAVP